MAQRESKSKKRQASGVTPVTPQEPLWRERMASWQSSGLTQVAFCRREGLSEGSFGWWKRELAQRDRQRAAPEAGASEATSQKEDVQAVRWVQVPARVRESEPARRAEPRQDGAFELVLRGERRVRMAADFDADGLRRLIAVVESLPC